MSMSNYYGRCEICNQKTWEDTLQEYEGFCKKCREEIENEELVCCECSEISDELNDDGLCQGCSEQDDRGDGDYNERGGFTQSYINYLNNQFN